MGKKLRLLSIKKILQNHLHIPQGSSLIVGVSGGADSTALLHLLSQSQLNLKLTAVYIDHGLRPTETPAEIAHVKDLAKMTGAQFMAIPIDVTKLVVNEKRSTEDAARILRYNAFQKVLKQQQASYIAVAHNADDQVEEFFLRVLRGSGRKGLSGMTKKHNKLIRPLLDFSKEDILNYLKKENISHCEDSSNKERVYLRNKVRLDILPYLEKYNPSLRKTVRNISNILAEEEDYLEQATENALHSCLTYCDVHSAIVDCHQLTTHHRALQKRIVESVFWQIEHQPNFEYIQAVLDLSQGNNGRGIQCSENLQVSKREGQLFFFYEEKTHHKNDSILALLPTPGTYAIEPLAKVITISSKPIMEKNEIKQLQVDAKTLHFPLTIRFHKDGEKFFPFQAPGRKKVSRFLTDRKIHREAKKKYPVLTHVIEGIERIIAVLGLEISTEYQTTNSTEEILTITWHDKELD